MRSTPSLRRFPGSAFETEFLRWAGLNNNDPTSRPFKADRCRLSLRFSPSGDRWCNVYDLVPAAIVFQVSQRVSFDVFINHTPFQVC